MHRHCPAPQYAVTMHSGKDSANVQATSGRSLLDQEDSAAASRMASIEEAARAALLAIAATETPSGPRTTIYRRWATKDWLVGAVLYRPFNVDPGDAAVEAVVVTAVGLHLTHPSRDCLGLLAQRHLPDKPWKMGPAGDDGNSSHSETTNRPSNTMPTRSDAPSRAGYGENSEAVAAQIMLWPRIDALRLGRFEVGDTARLDAMLLVQRLCRLADSTEKSWPIEKAIANAQEWCRWVALPPLDLSGCCEEAAVRLRASRLRNGPGGHGRMQRLIAACTKQ